MARTERKRVASGSGAGAGTVCSEDALDSAVPGGGAAFAVVSGVVVPAADESSAMPRIGPASTLALRSRWPSCCAQLNNVHDAINASVLCIEMRARDTY